MTPAEAAVLLGIAASFDNRKPDEASAQAWSLALEGLRFEDCRDVIVAHYRRSNEWLMPSHVIAEVRRLRSKRISEAGDPTPPPDLTPEQTIAWLTDWRRTVGDGETPAATYPGELKPRHLPDLRELLPSPDTTTAPHEETSR